MRLIAIVTLIGAALFASGPPQPSHAVTAETRALAAEAYAEGAEAFKAKDFETALGHFDRAFKLDPSPILLYNIARCHEEMGHLDESISNFKLYLARNPGSADRTDVERRIRVMEAFKRQLAESPPSESPAAPATTTTVVVEDDSLRWWGFGLTSAGLAGLALGGGFGIAADGAAESHRTANTRADKTRFEEDARSNATLSNASYVVGGILTLAGASILVWDLVSDDAPTVQVSPVTTAGGGAGVGLWTTF